MRYKVFSDGGSRGNPGQSAIGFVIYDSSNNKVFEYSKFIGISTNNIAEYTALLFSCYKLNHLKAKEVDFYLDSELVVKQIKGEYQIRDKNLKKVYDKVIENLKNFNYTITHVKREMNKEADSLVNQALDNEEKIRGKGKK